MHIIVSSQPSQKEEKKVDKMRKKLLYNYLSTEY